MAFTVIADFNWADGELEWVQETFGLEGSRWRVGADENTGTAMLFEREEDAWLYTLRWL